MEAYELQYADLMLLSSGESASSSLSAVEIQRLESIKRAVMENLGPTGPGLIAITGIPNASKLRRNLLPLARKFALLNNEDRKNILKEHGLGSDVPLKNLDRIVSSFAMQLKYIQGVESTDARLSHVVVGSDNGKQGHPDIEGEREDQCTGFEKLGLSFKELGFCMMEIGLCLARICDGVIGGHELEQSLLESCAAKGRLIHYHSGFDNLTIKQAAKKGGSRKARASGSVNAQQSIRNEKITRLERNQHAQPEENGVTSCKSQPNLWQQWHYDYGIFTVLTAPMFMSSCNSQRNEDDFCLISFELEGSSNQHTHLQIFDSYKKTVNMVRAPPESFIIQVGESADILSKGKLRPTLHSVCRPEKLENLSRETFVVFLQPAWSKKFSLLDYPTENLTSRGESTVVYCESNGTEEGLNKLTEEIQKIVPPLCLRIKDGMTFADFSKETTKQYYGGSGLQSNR